MTTFNDYVSVKAVKTAGVILGDIIKDNPAITFSQVEMEYGGLIAPPLELAIAWNNIVDISRQVDVDSLYSVRVKAVENLNKLAKQYRSEKPIRGRGLSRITRFFMSFGVMLGAFVLNGITWRGFFVGCAVLVVYPFLYATIMVLIAILKK